MPTDFLYKNAPLVEVIAEIKWTLVPLTSLPNGAIDPHFQAFTETLKSKIAEHGFTHVERLMPIDVPIELFPRKPIFRYRRAPDTYPLFQAGPGLLTINHVPPYQGWRDFRTSIDIGLELLFECYPLADRYLEVHNLELRYIDAFSKHHYFEKYYSFISKHLNFQLALPAKLLEESVSDPEDLQARCEFNFLVKQLENTRGILKLSPGTSKNQPAAILEFLIRAGLNGQHLEHKQILQWLDSAHEVVRTWFQDVITNDLRECIGPKINIEESQK